MCKVSVIMPIYNEEPYVAVAVGAILAQTLSDFELILVDDGSTDGTAALCTALAAQDDRIVFLRQEKSGVSAARNAGLAIAAGEFVYFTDADDYTAPTLLAEAVALAEANDADLVEFGFFKEVYDRKNRRRGTQELLPTQNGAMNRAQLAENILCGFAPTAYYISGHLFRRALLDGLRFADMPLAEDTVFVIHALKRAQKIVFCRKAYYHYAVRIGSSVNRYQPRRLACDCVLLDALRELTESFECNGDAARRLLCDRCAGSYLNTIYNLCLPDCPLSFAERVREMKRARQILHIEEQRRRFYGADGTFDAVKLFLVRHRLEWLMLLLGRLFIIIVRKR